MGVGWCELAGGRVWDRGELEMRRENFDGLSRGVKKDKMACRGAPLHVLMNQNNL
jgi:hypothetical protein